MANGLRQLIKRARKELQKHPVTTQPISQTGIEYSEKNQPIPHNDDKHYRGHYGERLNVWELEERIAP